MSVNTYLPHVVFVCEDKATRAAVTGFLNHPTLSGNKQFRNERVQKGWKSAAEKAREIIEGNSKASVVLAIDFDKRDNRLEKVREIITDAYWNQVLVIGSMDEVEDLTRQGLGLREKLGFQIAEECQENRFDTWNHNLLKHNLPELEQKAERFRDILFVS